MYFSPPVNNLLKKVIVVMEHWSLLVYLSCFALTRSLCYSTYAFQNILSKRYSMFFEHCLTFMNEDKKTPSLILHDKRGKMCIFNFQR